MVHLIKDENGKAIGWEFKPTTPEECEIAGTIRDLQFFGLKETAIEYKGISFHDNSIGKSEVSNLKTVS